MRHPATPWIALFVVAAFAVGAGAWFGSTWLAEDQRTRRAEREIPGLPELERADHVPPERTEVLDSAGSDPESAGDTSTRLAVFVRVAETGGMVPGAVVRVLPFRQEILQPRAPFSRLIADTDGRVEVAVAPGHYWVDAAAAEFGTIPQTFEAVAGRTTRIDLVVAPLVDFRARVLAPGGEPAGDAIVHADRIDTKLGYQRVFGRTDADGMLALPVPLLDLDRLVLSVVWRGLPPAEFTLTRAQLERRADTVLQIRIARFRGRCVDENGQPVGDVYVSIGEDKPSAASADDGTFEVRAAQWNGDRVVLMSESHATVGVPVSPSSGEVLDLGDIVLPTGRSLRGQVVGPDGRGVAGAYLRLYSERVEEWIDVEVTAADGTFAFDHVGEEAHTLYVRRTMQSWPVFQLEKDFEVRAGPEPVAVSLPEAVRATVHFRTEDGGSASIPRFRLRVTPVGEGTPVHDVRFDHDPAVSATFEVGESGMYEVSVDAPSWRPLQPLIAKITRGDVNEHEIVFAPRN